MRVAVVGGTGFVGNYIVESLLDNKHTPVLLVRSGSEQKLRRTAECDIVPGDVDVLPDLIELLKAADAVIYNIGILREIRSRGITFEATQFAGVERLLGAAKTCGVDRLLLMSANGVKPDGTAYQSTKYRAEALAHDSGIDVTVFRPSVIFGDPHGLMEFASQLHRDMVSPPIPAIGFYNASGPQRGDVMLSPVHVEDVAAAFVKALEEPGTIGRTYALAGPDALSWTEMLRRIAAATGRKKWIIPMPVELMRLTALLLDWLPFFPVTRDQLTMLAEGNIGSQGELVSLIGREPRAFTVEHLGYLCR